MKMTVIPIVIGALGTIPNDWLVFLSNRSPFMPNQYLKKKCSDIITRWM